MVLAKFMCLIKENIANFQTIATYFITKAIKITIEIDFIPEVCRHRLNRLKLLIDDYFKATLLQACFTLRKKFQV